MVAPVCGRTSRISGAWQRVRCIRLLAVLPKVHVTQPFAELPVPKIRVGHPAPMPELGWARLPE